ncbi:hypothetical protein DYI24_21385 [Rhodopseudomonas sp. BR0C11]|uniref:hypothetical protein n=1 Tax=Rhodopseudomonas sp. BR0C11 TaxID=2269370 RepID=UPI0013E00D45|nr:hypothetical protein [Rhodopseudomonas sp. BR0C11]NEV79590.1 hypothetical protein [Rhodopseudomonas sp. BR0C11]
MLSRREISKLSKQIHRSNAFERYRDSIGALVDEYRSFRTDQAKADRGRFIRDCLTLFGLFTAAGISAFQLHEMIRVYAPIKAQAEFTQESYVAVQRPFVDGKSLVISDSVFSGYHFFQVHLENTGNTRTQNAEVFTHFEFREDEVNDPPPAGRVRPAHSSLDPELVFNSIKDNFPAQPISLAAKGIVPINVGGIPTGAMIKMAKNRAEGYVYGLVRYNDGFAGTPRRISKFCYAVVPLLDADGKLDVKYGLCWHWNCADEECENDKSRYFLRMAQNRARGQGLPPPPGDSK